MLSHRQRRGSDTYSFEEFRDCIGRALGLTAAHWTESSLLFDDLELDSLQMLEVVIFMEELGAELFEELMPHVVTLGDLYEHYVTRVSAKDR